MKKVNVTFVLEYLAQSIVEVEVNDDYDIENDPDELFTENRIGWEEIQDNLGDIDYSNTVVSEVDEVETEAGITF